MKVHECKLVYIQTNPIGKCVSSSIDTCTAPIAEVGGSNLIFKFFKIWFDSSKIYLVHEKKRAFLQKWTKMDITKTLHSCIRFANFIAYFKGYNNIYRLIQLLFKNETTVKSYINSKVKVMYRTFLFVGRFRILYLIVNYDQRNSKISVTTLVLTPTLLKII